MIKKLLLLSMLIGLYISVYPQSCTLPIFYLQTDSAKEITTKDYYIGGSFWIDAQYSDEYESVGSANNPLLLQVKGRGNHTWNRFDKKPYKIKLDKKIDLLGLSKSKHFILMAHADRNLAFLHDEIGFEVSRRMEMPWTVRQIPVELVLNGEYKGLYFLNEQIRVSKDRVDITEQKEGETATDLITGGWLLEIDQYREENQLEFKEGNGNPLYVTHHSPESLSDEQRTYLRNLIQACDSCIYVKDKTSTEWEKLIDLESCARFYLVNEIMDNVESYCGSCWFYKDRGENTKIQFGPVWDFGYSVYTNNDKFIYEKPPYRMTWIAEIAKFPRFQQKVLELWNDYYKKGKTDINDCVERWTEKIRRAAEEDYKLWPQYGVANIDSARNVFISFYNHKIEFLRGVWNTGSTDISNALREQVKLIEYSNNLITIFETNNIYVQDVAVYNSNGFRVGITKIERNKYTIDARLGGVFIVCVKFENGDIVTQKFKK